MKRKATAVWHGTGLEGKGTLNSPSHMFMDTPYSAKARFQNETGIYGTNPEELIAAAHAGCFSMALSFAITKAGFTPDSITTDATVSLDPVEGGFAITSITLDLVGKVTGMKKAQFTELANGAKTGCPVSKALAAVPITLNIKFEA
jgi:lipoyl-dependent peroxiredoxin